MQGSYLAGANLVKIIPGLRFEDSSKVFCEPASDHLEGSCGLSWKPKTWALPDQRWTVLGRNGPVMAVSGLRTTHVLPPAQRASVRSLEDTFLDVGALSREEVERMGIRPGDGIAPQSEFVVMANGRYAGKAWDDHISPGRCTSVERGDAKSQLHL